MFTNNWFNLLQCMDIFCIKITANFIKHKVMELLLQICIVFSNLHHLSIPKPPSPKYVIIDPRDEKVTAAAKFLVKSIAKDNMFKANGYEGCNKDLHLDVVYKAANREVFPSIVSF